MDARFHQEVAIVPKKPKEVVVFIDGLFAGGVAGSARKALSQKFESARFLTLHCGAVSSVRDRAVECFYQLKGGQTNYSTANPSLEEGHGKFGLEFPGLHPEWDEKNPIHIVAYSLGAPTARFLQHLLIRQAFTSDDGARIRSTGAWIASITTLNGVNNGTVAVYAVGLSPWSLNPIPLSILWWIFTLIYVAVWTEWERGEKFWKLQLKHWEVRKEHGVSFQKLLGWRPGEADNGGRDLCPQSMADLNLALLNTAPYPTTRYLACCASATAAVPVVGLHVPQPRVWLQWKAAFLLPLSLVVSVTAYLQAIAAMLLAPFTSLLALLASVLSLQHKPKAAPATPKSSKAVLALGNSVVVPTAKGKDRRRGWGWLGLRREQANDGVCSVACQATPFTDASRGLCQGRHCCLNSLMKEGVPMGRWTEVQMPTGFTHVEFCQGTKRAEEWLMGLCTLILQKKVFLGGEEDVAASPEKIASIRQKLDRHDKWIGKVMDKAKSPVKRSPSKEGP